MKMLLFFIVTCFLVGGTRPGRFVRERPPLLIAFAGVTAASYWSLGIVLG